MTEEPTEPETVDLETPDLAAANRAAFEQQFPGVLADGVIDAERLKELLDVDVVGAADDRERYGLMWAGKKEAVQSLQTASRGTLIPDFEASVDWNTAHNVFIEGDNLEVLKLLQRAYNDQVKLVYIDPPYNTGNDFVYNDDFADGLRGYLEYTGQVDAAGNRVSTYADLAGRRHSRWMSMMYPRLVLARNTLTNDGSIFVSVDDNELPRLTLLLDEVFGSENLLGILPVVTNLKGNNDQFGFAGTHEYLVAYARDISKVDLKGLPLSDDQLDDFDELDEYGRYKRGANLRATGKNAPRAKRPNLWYPVFVSSDLKRVSAERLETGDHEIWPLDASGAQMSWRWGAGRMFSSTHDIEVHRQASGKIDLFKKQRIEADDVLNRFKPKSIFYKPEYSGTSAAAQLANVLPTRPFEYPKSVSLIEDICSMVLNPTDTVMDFFAGSGTTGHAVMSLNAADGGRRRFIAVTLPEAVVPGSAGETAGYSTIAEIGLDRVKAAAEHLGVDGGLRVERLATSNFRERSSSDPEELFDLRESTLDDGEYAMEHITQEVLLREGVRLDATWQRHEASDAQVIVADGVAVVMSLELTQEIADAALALEPKVVVFLEDGFAGADAVKANTFTNAKNANIVMKTV